MGTSPAPPPAPFPKTTTAKKKKPDPLPVVPDLSTFSISNSIFPSASRPSSPHSTLSPLPSPRSATPSGLTVNVTHANDDYLSTTGSGTRKRRRVPEYPDNVVRMNGVALGQEAFELLVVGCGGGPLETNLSSYLVKPFSSHWSDGCTSLEAGSALGALAVLIEKNPESFIGFGLGLGMDKEEKALESGLAASKAEERRSKIGRGEEGKAAGKVWECVKCFAVTHAHLDHIQGLIISSGASLAPRPLYGTIRTLNNIDKLMDGGVWPRLAGWEEDGATKGRAYLYRNLPAPTTDRYPLSPSLSLHAYPLSHGLDPSAFHPKKSLPPLPPSNSHPNGILPPPPEDDHPECYDSTAFFVKEDITGRNTEFLFFGDVEPDSISKRPLNWRVWQDAAPKIVEKSLRVIFLECSYPTSQPTEQLWGHLSPPFVLEELVVLAKAVKHAKIARGVPESDAAVLPLAGVSVVIIHIKDDILSLPATPLPSPLPSPASSSGSHSRAHSPLRPRQRVSLSAHYPLSMSPPLPSLPTRRASTASGYFPHKPSTLGGSRKSSSASSTFGPPAISVDRRASLPGFVGSGGTGFEKLLVGKRGSVDETARMEGSFSDSVPEEQEDELVEDDEEEETVHERIERELNELEEEEKTGVSFVRACQGMRLVF